MYPQARRTASGRRPGCFVASAAAPLPPYRAPAPHCCSREERHSGGRQRDSERKPGRPFPCCFHCRRCYDPAFLSTAWLLRLLSTAPERPPRRATCRGPAAGIWLAGHGLSPALETWEVFSTAGIQPRTRALSGESEDSGRIELALTIALGDPEWMQPVRPAPTVLLAVSGAALSACCVSNVGGASESEAARIGRWPARARTPPLTFALRRLLVATFARVPARPRHLWRP